MELALVVGPIAAITAIAVAVAVARARRTKLPVVSIADAAEGVVVHLVGVIAPGETIEAPLSGRACVHYELEILGAARGQNRIRPGVATRLPPRVREARSVAFAIDDGTGRALIDPSGARFTIQISERQMRLGEPSEVHRRLASLHGMRDGADLFREGVLGVGARVAVIGMVVREPDPDGAARAAGYRGDAPTRLRLGGSATQPLVIRALTA